MAELKPCPLCIAKATSHEDEEMPRWCVECSACGLVKFAGTEAEAIAVWNSRAEYPVVAAARMFVHAAINEPTYIERQKFAALTAALKVAREEIEGAAEMIAVARDRLGCCGEGDGVGRKADNTFPGSLEVIAALTAALTEIDKALGVLQ